MMSAALLTTVDVEQSSVRPVTADLLIDQSQSEVTSFAKSFNESVGDSTLSQVKSGSDPATIGLVDTKSGDPAKQLDEVRPSSGGINGKALVSHDISTLGRPKSDVADRLVQPQATALAIPKEEAASGEAKTKEIESATPTTLGADDELTDSDTKPVTGPTNERPLPTGMESAGPPSVSSVSGVVTQKEIEIEGKTKPADLSKKTEKTQERVATPKVAQKPVETAVNAITLEAKPAVVSSAEGAVLMRANAVASEGMPSSEVGKASEGFRIVSSGAPRTSNGIAPTVWAGVVRKDGPLGTKVSDIGTETSVISAGDMGALQKSGAGLEKIAAVALPAGSDGDNKGPSVSGPVQAVPHTLSGGAEIAPGMSTAVFASPGAPGGSTALKSSVGDTIRDIADMPAGSREQMGFGGATAPMEGVPRTLTTTPTALEVGIQDGTHGWLKVRAEMVDSGVVNASVSATTTVGQEMLHRELPSLTAYLQTEKVTVNTVVVHATAAAANDLRGSSGMDSAGGQTPQRNDERGEQQQYMGKATADNSNEAMAYQNLREADVDASLPRATYAGGGSWLNVRA